MQCKPFLNIKILILFPSLFFFVHSINAGHANGQQFTKRTVHSLTGPRATDSFHIFQSPHVPVSSVTGHHFKNSARSFHNFITKASRFMDSFHVLTITEQLIKYLIV